MKINLQHKPKRAKTLYRLYIIPILFLLLFLNIQDLKAQCTGGSQYTDGAVTPTTSWQTVAIAGQHYRTFTATAGRTYEFSFGDNGGASGYDSYLSLNNNSDVNQTYSDDAIGDDAKITWQCATGATYRILATLYQCNAQTGLGTLAYRLVPLPGNDDCAGATTVTVGAAAVTGDITGASQSIAGCTGDANDDVWYKFTTTSAGNYLITVDGSSSFDAVVDLRSGACNGSNVVCANSTSADGVETIMNNCAATTTYYVRVYDFNSGIPATKTFTIEVSSCGNLTPPYSEGFESISSNNTLPSCMAATNMGSKVLTYTSAQGSYNRTPRTGSNFASFMWSCDDWMFSQPLTLTGGQTYDFSMYYITDGYSGWTTLEAKFGSTQTSGGMTTSITGATVSSPVNTTYSQMTGTFTPSSTDTYFIGIHCLANATPYYLSFDDISVTAQVPTPAVALSNNGTQVGAGSPSPGATDWVLHKSALAVTVLDAVLTGMTCTTAGNYQVADITNMKVRYSSDATLDAGDATLSTIVPTTAGAQTFTSFTSQNITSGSTGYIFITTDIAATAVTTRTISVNALATTNFTFTSANKSGSTGAGGTQTITAPTLTAPVLSNTGSSNQIAFNNSYINDNTPLFRASSTVTSGVINRFQVEINTLSNFTGTAYTQTFSGTYTSGTQYDFKCYSLSAALPTTDGVTYYVRMRASYDGGTTWGNGWSTGTYSFTYKSTGDVDWMQTTEPQFDVNTLTNCFTPSADNLQIDRMTPIVFDNFTDGNYTASPAWTVVSGAMAVASNNPNASSNSSNVLRENTGATLQKIYTNSTQAYGAWEYRFKGDYQNTEDCIDYTTQGRLLLMYKDNVDPTNAATDGYYVYLDYLSGGSNFLGLYRKDNGVNTAIISSSWSPDYNWHTIKVTRTSSGLFELFFDGASKGTYTDNTYTTSSYLGIYKTSTYTSDDIAWDDIKTSPTSGNAISSLIDFSSFIGVTAWDKIYFTDVETGSNVTYHVYYDNAGTPTIIPDAALAGNAAGFGTSPITISGLVTATYPKLYIKADLSYTSASPQINDWKVTCTYCISKPTASAATSVSATQFTANWSAVTGAEDYYIDIASDAQFSNIVINNQSVGGAVTNYVIGGLTPGATYYYRVRAYKTTPCTSENSNPIPILMKKYYFPVDKDGGQEYTTIASAVSAVNTIWGTTAFDADVTVEVFQGATAYAEQVAPNTNLNPTSGGKLIIKGHPGDNVIVDGATFTEGILINAIDYVTVSGFEVKNATADGIKVVGGNCTIENNICHDNGGAGTGTNIVVWGGGNTNTIQYNKCYGDGTKPETGIRVYQSNTANIHHNLLYTHNKYGIWVQESGTATIENNTSYDNGSSSAGAPALQFSEYFASGIPGGWSQAQTGGYTTEGVLWKASASQCGSRTINAPVSGAYLIVDADCDGASGMAHGTSVLTSPTYNLTGKSSCQLKLSHYFYYFSADTAKIQMKIGAGAWTTIASWTTASTTNAQNEAISISSADNQASVQFRFWYAGVWSWYWAIDNFEIWGTGAGTTTGAGLYATAVGGVTMTAKNNILVAKSGSGDSYYSLQTGANVTVSSGSSNLSNNFYNNGNTYFNNINGTKYSSIATWNSTYGTDLSISSDPLFVDAGAGDFHEKSQSGSYHGGEWPPLSATDGTWTTDASNSPSLDAATGTVANEPAPNGNKVNQGCYGNTVQASKSADGTTKVQAPGTQIAGTTISSLINTIGAAVSVFRFTLRDMGGDGLNTYVTKFIIKNNSGTADWSDHIAGAILYDDGASADISDLSVAITDNDITFTKTSGSFTVLDNSTKDVTLKIWLNTSNIVDAATLLFKIPSTSHGFIADIVGSQMISVFGADVTSNTFTIGVTATQLAFVQEPSNVCISSSISPAVTVSASDANGNLDKTALSVSITATNATLTGSPVSQNTSNGTATFSALTFSTIGSGVYFTASASGCSNATSSTFTVATSPSAPVAITETNLGTTSFNASWNAVSTATTYYLDVDNNSDFSSPLAGYNNQNVGNVTIYAVTGLTANTTYYYRVRANNGCGTSGNSNTISPVTLAAPDVVVGAYIAGNFTNNGTFDQTNDANFAIMYGQNKEILGSGVYTQVKIRIFPSSGKITFNGAITSGKAVQTKVNTGKTFEIASGKTYKNDNFINDGILTMTNLSVFENSGDWTNNGTHSWADNTPIVKFNGNGNLQTVKTNSATNEFKNIVFDNKNGSNIPGHIALTDDMPIAVSGTFTYGIVKTAATWTQKVIFKDGATAGSAITNFNNNSFVRGTVKKIGNDNFIFPVGFYRLATVKTCAPIGIDNSLGGAADEYSVEYSRTWGTGFPPIPQIWTDSVALGIPGYTSAYMDGASSPVLDHISRQEFWDVTTNTINYRPVTLYSLDLGFSGIAQADISDVQVAHYKTGNSKWENMSGTFVIDDATAPGKGHILSTTAFTAYSPITFGSKTGKNPLPVDLISFTAQCVTSNIQLDWSTSSETNNSHYLIEKSFDAQQWFEVAKVTGSGNTNELKKYQYFDKADLVNQIIYYRLTQVDFDGISKEFNTVSTSCMDNLNKESYSIYPNPAKDALYISIQSAKPNIGVLVLTNELGQKIDITNLLLEKGSNQLTLNTTNLASGVYYISIMSDNSVYPVKRFVISR